ncbi:MAG: PAS domain-containing protein, partial [Melioribacteraceae bacterium]|nr:PAS domain-containing protein [Melioribacteraceae bacterium]
MKKFIKNNFSNKNNGESKKSDFEENFKPQDFVDFSAIGIFKLNVDAVIEYANQTLAQILEFKSRSDLIGINFKDEIISESTDWEKLRAKLYKHRIAKNFIIPLKQNSGASIFVRVDIRAASDEKGDPT